MIFSFHKLSSLKDSDINVVFIADITQLPEFLKNDSDKMNKTFQCFKNFSGKYGETFSATIEIHDGIKKFMFCGIGKTEELTKIKILELGGIIGGKLNCCSKAKTANIIVDNKELEAQKEFFIINFAEGMKLKNYSFNKYYKDKKDKHQMYLEEVSFYGNNLDVQNAFAEREKIVDCTNFTRDLVSEPANILTPEAFVEVCNELKELGVKVTVLDKKRLKELNMNAILGVGQGSHHGTYVVTMEWNGGENDKPVALVGKGVTFDTGGINLKPSGHSLTMMKYDMGGAAVVTGVMKSLALRKAKVNVVGAIGIAENMPSGHAQRPGDVVTSMSGQTIEVDNTDAEGRLLLCDVMWYAQENFKPKIMIDLATLTGSIVIALGSHNAGLFSNDDQLANQLLEAGLSTGEKLWRLPIDTCYDELINSSIADVKNAGKYGAGSIAAAQFLHRFVQKGCAWAHLDIAGVNWLDNGSKVSPKGATGYGVRLLNEFFIQNYEKK
jgi:leucyl aminopeptidase